jgi:MFS family permease
VFARGAMVTGAAMLLGTVGGGLLGQIDLSLPYAARAILLVAVFVVAFVTMRELGFTPRTLRVSAVPREMRRVARNSLSFGWHTRSVRLLMSCSFLQWGFISWGFYAWQPYFLEFLGDQWIWAAGMFAALVSLSMILGNTLVNWFGQFCGRRSTLLLWAAGIQTVSAVGVGLADSLWLASALFLITTGTFGVTGPVKQAYLHQVVSSEHRASVISLDSMIGNAGGVVGQTGLGYLSRVRSIPDGYVVGGLATVLALPLLAMLRGMGERADVIVGKEAGLRGPCAGQGIPEISQVDATPDIGAESTSRT